MKSNYGKWESILLAAALADFVPSAPGVYTIAAVHRVIGMPLNLEVLYIGKSKNLKRRFREHANPWREHNEALNNRAMSGGLEFWFLPTDLKSLDSLERNLIHLAQPLTNKIRYRSFNHEQANK